MYTLEDTFPIIAIDNEQKEIDRNYKAISRKVDEIINLLEFNTGITIETISEIKDLIFRQITKVTYDIRMLDYFSAELFVDRILA